MMKKNANKQKITQYKEDMEWTVTKQSLHAAIIFPYHNLCTHFVLYQHERNK